MTPKPWRIAALCLILLLAAVRLAAEEPAKPTTKESEAALVKAYGLDHFDQVTEIRFTVTAVTADSNTNRSWLWQPATGKVELSTQGKTGPLHVTYNRGQVSDKSSDDVRQADRWFLDDTYWLMLPMYLTWTKEVKVEDTGPAALPIASGRGERIVVTYPRQGTATAGDVYELYLADNGRVAQSEYYRAGENKPTQIAAWKSEAQVGPIWFALERRGADGKPRLAFSDLAIRFKDEKDWTPAVVPR